MHHQQFANSQRSWALQWLARFSKCSKKLDLFNWCLKGYLFDQFGKPLEHEWADPMGLARLEWESSQLVTSMNEYCRGLEYRTASTVLPEARETRADMLSYDLSWLEGKKWRNTTYRLYTHDMPVHAAGSWVGNDDWNWLIMSQLIVAKLRVLLQFCISADLV